jgi:hypothetical protein
MEWWEKQMITKELRSKIRTLREPVVEMEGKRVPGSVPFLRDLIAAAENPLDRDALLTELAGEYLRSDLDDEHLLVQRERVAQNPEAAVVWLALAHSLGMRDDGAAEAKQAVIKAVEISRQTNTLVRYSLTCQAQVARQTNDPSLFEQALRSLIADVSNYREEDSDLNDHIVADLPTGFCTVELEVEYRNLLEREDPEKGGPDR